MLVPSSFYFNAHTLSKILLDHPPSPCPPLSPPAFPAFVFRAFARLHRSLTPPPLPCTQVGNQKALERLGGWKGAEEWESSRRGVWLSDGKGDDDGGHRRPIGYVKVWRREAGQRGPQGATGDRRVMRGFAGASRCLWR